MGQQLASEGLRPAAAPVHGTVWRPACVHGDFKGLEALGWVAPPAEAGTANSTVPFATGPLAGYTIRRMNDLGKLLVVLGLVLVAVGVLLWSGIGRGWLGRLPGDIHYSRGNFTLYFPVVTCIILSILLTLIFRLFRK